MSGESVEVLPMSRVAIRAVAVAFRKHLQVDDQLFVPIVEIAEFILPQAGFLDFQVLTQREMGNNHGLAYPDERIIQIREDVYDGACRGDGRDRATIAHEIGHVLLHGNIPHSRRFRADPARSIPAYRDSEWQAKAFAGELLCSPLAAKNGARALAQACGVSLEAAELQRKAYVDAGLI